MNMSLRNSIITEQNRNDMHRGKRGSMKHNQSNRTTRRWKKRMWSKLQRKSEHKLGYDGSEF